MHRTDQMQDIWFLRARSILLGGAAGMSCAFCLGEQIRERARTNQRHKDAEKAKHARN